MSFLSIRSVEDVIYESQHIVRYATTPEGLGTAMRLLDLLIGCSIDGDMPEICIQRLMSAQKHIYRLRAYRRRWFFFPWSRYNEELAKLREVLLEDYSQSC